MPLIALDPSKARAGFHRAPFAMRHGLAGHDLFTLPRLVELAKSMPRDRIEYNSGRIEPGVRPEDVPGLSMPAEEVIRRIENANAWLVIKGVELNPAYRGLLHGFLTEVSSAAGPGTEQFEDLQGFDLHLLRRLGDAVPFRRRGEQFRSDPRRQIRPHLRQRRSQPGPEESLELSPSKHRNQPYRADFERRRRGLCPHPRRCRSHSLSVAALGSYRRQLVRIDGDDLEDAGRQAAEQGPADERHAAPLWPAATGARPVGAR